MAKRIISSFSAQPPYVPFWTSCDTLILLRLTLWDVVPVGFILFPPDGRASGGSAAALPLEGRCAGGGWRRRPAKEKLKWGTRAAPWGRRDASTRPGGQPLTCFSKPATALYRTLSRKAVTVFRDNSNNNNNNSHSARVTELCFEPCH